MSLQRLRRGEKVSTPAAKKAVAAPPKAPNLPAPKRPAVVDKDHRSDDRHSDERQSDNRHTGDDPSQLRFGSGVRLWIRVIAINRKPGGSFNLPWNSVATGHPCEPEPAQPRNRRRGVGDSGQRTRPGSGLGIHRCWSKTTNSSMPADPTDAPELDWRSNSIPAN